jgi:hypothetical protein
MSQSQQFVTREVGTKQREVKEKKEGDDIGKAESPPPSTTYDLFQPPAALPSDKCRWGHGPLLQVPTPPQRVHTIFGAWG